MFENPSAAPVHTKPAVHILYARVYVYGIQIDRYRYRYVDIDIDIQIYDIDIDIDIIGIYKYYYIFTYNIFEGRDDLFSDAENDGLHQLQVTGGVVSCRAPQELSVHMARLLSSEKCGLI